MCKLANLIGKLVDVLMCQLFLGIIHPFPPFVVIHLLNGITEGGAGHLMGVLLKKFA
jgi:hypothetical protein